MIKVLKFLTKLMKKQKIQQDFQWRWKNYIQIDKLKKLKKRIK